MQIFGELLGDGRYKQMLAAADLPITLEWVNTTVSTVEVRQRSAIEIRHASPSLLHPYLTAALLQRPLAAVILAAAVAALHRCTVALVAATVDLVILSANL